MFKNILATAAILLAFVSFTPYFKDIIKNKTKPHVYSWFIWGYLSLIIFALQIKGGAGPGAYSTLFASFIALIVIILGLKHGTKDITRLDTTFLLLSMLATAVWLFARQPTFSLILLVAIEVSGFFPSIRKSWNKPFDETVFTWALNGFRYILCVGALIEYNMLTFLYPFVWAISNLLFALMLVVRRHQISSKNHSAKVKQYSKNLEV